MDENLLRKKQRQNELKAFLRYENALRAAYAKSQNPHPGTQRFRQNPSRRVRWQS